MSETPPIAFKWDGEAMTPLNQRFARLCDQHFVVGLNYVLSPYEGRSSISHNHFFASVHDAWLNLPEHLSDQFLTADHLRRYALIKAGFFDERSFVCASKAEALRLAAFVKPIDTYALVTVHEAIVRVFTAKSQSHKAMGKAEFQRSKTAVLEVLSQMIGVQAAELKENSKAVA